MNTVITTIALVSTLAISTGVAAASPFACGQYNPTTAISTTSTLALTNTAMLGSPGTPNLPSTYMQSSWFLIDSFGTGALMGCSPKSSVIQGWPQTNSYNSNGTVKQIVAKRFNTGGGDPITATLNFTYETDSAYYLKTAENFCMSIGGDKITYSMTYKEGLLSIINGVPDSGCPSNTPFTIVYGYNDKNVPALPTSMTVSQTGKNDEVTKYAYTVNNNLIQSIDIDSPDTGSYTLNIGYTGQQISSMTLKSGTQTGAEFSIAYVNTNLWKNMIDPRYGWGLTIDYFSNSTVESTVQTTGDPSALPSHFHY